MTRVLLTGATGFVGGHVLRRILHHAPDTTRMEALGWTSPVLSPELVDTVRWHLAMKERA